MKTQGRFLILLLAVGLIGCSRQPEPRHIVILPDVSGSIERESVEQAFKAIDELVGQLRRGDRIAIIPILGDAQAEASGRIIRFQVPQERRAYDADLRDFRRKLSADLAEMQNTAISNPGSKTDILGSVALAEEEFQSISSLSTRTLFILSDFIQEDREVDFTRNRMVANKSISAQFATALAKQRRTGFRSARVYLGLMRSTTYMKLQDERREGIREFWLGYFASAGAHAILVADGPGLLPHYFSDFCQQDLLP